MKPIEVISKNIVVDESILQIFIDNANRILLPYPTMEHFMQYEVGTFQKKIRSKFIQEFLFAHDIEILDVNCINIKGVGTNLRKAMTLDDLFALIRYELEKMNKKKKESKLLDAAIKSYVNEILTKLK